MLEVFRSRHTPWGGTLPTDREATREEIAQAVRREGRPCWNEASLRGLVDLLGYAGLGEQSLEEVRHALDELAR